MLDRRQLKILTDLLKLPTAPFTEGAVRRYILDFCSRRPLLRVREDAAGNILVHYKLAARSRPVCLCAHTDHPGFRALRMKGANVLQARWLGGVPAEYFPGAGVRFFSDGDWIRGRITKTKLKTLGLERPGKMVDQVQVSLNGARPRQVAPGSPGMWDLPDPQLRGRLIHARGCDDVAGCSAILAAIEHLVRRRIRTEAYFLFTRAEEVGFIGAIAACRLGTIPRRCLVVAIETSSVIPGVVMGAGPILRVGDKSSVFTPELTAWCGRVAEKLAARDADFRYQRKLMDGGSCESSAYCRLGYAATGLCIALGNYHNCDRRRRRIAPEFIDVHDLGRMIRWFVALTSARAELGAAEASFEKRLARLERRYRRLLAATSRI